MALNQVQQDFVNGAFRPFLETVIKFIHDADTFNADYNALQAGPDALPEDATVLDDDGVAPRSDAPELTGLNVKQLNDFVASMSAVLTPTAKQVLIGKMVRSLNLVLKV